VGIDCVARCVNDVICGGAKPLIFLDYIACGKNFPARIQAIVEGITEVMPPGRLRPGGRRDRRDAGLLSHRRVRSGGFTVGVVDKSKILDNDNVKVEMFGSAALQRACTPTASPWCARSLMWKTATSDPAA
jgi:phosphoribosylformylglycinamidine cyclo-ligase